MGLNPEVRINVNEALSLAPNQGATIVTLIGTAQYGPVNEVIQATDFSGVLNIFQEDVGVNTSITKAAEVLFNNGASALKIVRIEDGDALEANVALDGNAGGEAGVLTFTALNKGEYGDGFSVDVDVQGTGRILYVRNGDATETFDNGGNANGYTTNQLIVDALNSSTTGSRFVSVAVKAGSESTNIVDATTGFTQLASGDNGADNIAASDYTDAFDTLLLTEDWDLLVCPSTGQSVEVEATDAFQTSINAKIQTRASTHKKYSVFLSGVELNEVLATSQARTTAGDRFVLCAPSIQATSRVDGSTINLNGTYLSCAVAGIIAGNDVEVAATRKVLSVNDLMVDTVTGKKYYNNLEVESFLSSRICVCTKIENALKVSRGVTRISDVSSIYFEISIRRIVDSIRGQVQASLDDYLGDPNIERIRKAMAALIDGILQINVNDEVIVNFTPSSVVEGISPDTVDVSFTIQPTFATNFIDVTISVNRV